MAVNTMKCPHCGEDTEVNENDLDAECDKCGQRIYEMDAGE